MTVFGHFDPKKGQKPRNLHKHHFYFCWIFQKSETNPKILLPSHFFFLCPFFQKSVQKKYDDLHKRGTTLLNALYLILIFILLHHTQPYRVRRAHLDQQQQEPGKNQDFFRPRNGILCHLHGFLWYSAFKSVVHLLCK